MDDAGKRELQAQMKAAEDEAARGEDFEWNEEFRRGIQERGLARLAQERNNGHDRAELDAAGREKLRAQLQVGLDRIANGEVFDWDDDFCQGVRQRGLARLGSEQNLKRD